MTGFHLDRSELSPVPALQKHPATSRSEHRRTRPVDVKDTGHT